MIEKSNCQMIVIGASAGGLDAISYLLGSLPGDFSLPIVVVQHLAPDSNDTWPNLLNRRCAINVKEAEEKEQPTAGNAYLAPANYHLLIEMERTFTLTVEDPVSYARPSIDVLFETAADAYAEHLVGIVMTGANSDGARGLRCIRENHGLTVVQDPDTAAARAMPEAAIRIAAPAVILKPAAIGELLLNFHQRQLSC